MTTPVSTRLRFCAEVKPRACGMVIFGASGDLTKRKLMPALYRLFCRKLLPEHFYILGCARTAFSSDEFRNSVAASLPSGKARGEFLSHVHYLSGQYDDPTFYTALGSVLLRLNGSFGCPGAILFYLAVPPLLYEKVVTLLGRSQLVREKDAEQAWRRVVIEKPFGRDLTTAVALDRAIHQVLAEHQIYRIDHYLGKETVQNILMFRFANVLFEPVWNRQYVDHVQITVGESIGVGDRAGYFDHAGHMRDMFQNHMLMMTALTAMEPPGTFEADSVRNEVVKLLSAIRPFPQEELASWVVRGQYTEGEVEGEKVVSYRAEKGVRPDSQTETFVAAKLRIDNWRWHGVPFYLRGGKRLGRKLSEIAVYFKQVPHCIFKPLLPEDLSPNVLVLTVQPDEGVSLTMQAKQPGAKLCVGDLTLRFSYRGVFGGEVPDAYERLLLDALVGDQTLFIRNDAIEVAWELITPCLRAWEEASPAAGPLHPYPAGSWGPAAAEELLRRDGRSWGAGRKEKV